jgi:predicted flap endonuclease-1-like 5' DNA nuclease
VQADTLARLDALAATQEASRTRADAFAEALAEERAGLDALASDHASTQPRLDALEASRTGVSGGFDSVVATLVDVQAALVASEAREAALAARVDAQASALTSLREALQAAEARVAALVASRAEPAASPVDVPAFVVGPPSSVESASVVVAPTSSAELSLVAAPSALPRAPIDLQRIKGIGPKFAKALVAAGISDAAAIADWTEADVARAASLVGVRPERIVRDDWIGQARALCAPA